MRPSDEELAARCHLTVERVRAVLAEMRQDWDALDAADYSDAAMDAFARTKTARGMGYAAATPRLSPERVQALWEEVQAIQQERESG